MTAAPPPSAPSALVDRYLQEQQATAVDRFARAHDASQADGDTPTGRYSALLAGHGARRRPAVRLRGRPRRLLRLQVVRRRMPRAERPRGERIVARRRVAARRQPAAAGRAARHHGLPPLPGPGLHARLSGRCLREGSGHGDREAPRRPVLRLPVLHARLSLRGAEIQPRKGHRPQVRHVQRAAGGRRGAGLRAVVPERRHRDSRGRCGAGSRGVGNQPVRAGCAGAGTDAADHYLPDPARPAAEHDPGRLLRRPSRRRALVADSDAGVDAVVGGGVPGRADAGTVRPGRAERRHPSGAQRERAGVRVAGVGRERAAPRPPSARVPGGHRFAAFVAEPRDPGVRPVRGAGGGVRRLAGTGTCGLARPARCSTGRRVAGLERGVLRHGRRALLGDGVPIYEARFLEWSRHRLPISADYRRPRAGRRVDPVDDCHRRRSGGGRSGHRRLRRHAVPWTDRRHRRQAAVRGGAVPPPGGAADHVAQAHGATHDRRPAQRHHGAFRRRPSRRARHAGAPAAEPPAEQSGAWPGPRFRGAGRDALCRLPGG